jgi:hypothetical protein
MLRNGLTVGRTILSPWHYTTCPVQASQHRLLRQNVNTLYYSLVHELIHPTYRRTSPPQDSTRIGCLFPHIQLGSNFNTMMILLVWKVAMAMANGLHTTRVIHMLMATKQPILLPPISLKCGHASLKSRPPFAYTTSYTCAHKTTPCS